MTARINTYEPANTSKGWYEIPKGWRVLWSWQYTLPIEELTKLLDDMGFLPEPDFTVTMDTHLQRNCGYTPVVDRLMVNVAYEYPFYGLGDVPAYLTKQYNNQPPIVACYPRSMDDHTNVDEVLEGGRLNSMYILDAYVPPGGLIGASLWRPQQHLSFSKGGTLSWMETSWWFRSKEATT